MTPYPVTNLTNGTAGFVGFLQGINTHYMFGWLGNLILISLSLVMFGSFIWSTNDVRRSLAATCFLSFLIAFLLRALSLVSDLALFITLILAGIGLAFAGKQGE
jgi:hypothetical protein